MSAGARVALAALPAAAVLIIAMAAKHPAHRAADEAAPVVAAALATPPPRRAAARTPSPLPVARRALRWLLAAESGAHDRPPHATFTPSLERDLAARPPRQRTSGPRARIARVREQAPLGALRRMLATVERGRRREPVTLLVACGRACLVAGVE